MLKAARLMRITGRRQEKKSKNERLGNISNKYSIKIKTDKKERKENVFPKIEVMNIDNPNVEADG